MAGRKINTYQSETEIYGKNDSSSLSTDFYLCTYGKNRESPFFYDRLLNTIGNTWSLKPSGTSGNQIKEIRGFLTDQDLTFSIENSFDRGGEFPILDGILGDLKAGMDKANKMSPAVYAFQKALSGSKLSNALSDNLGADSPFGKGAQDLWDRTKKSVNDQLDQWGIHLPPNSNKNSDAVSFFTKTLFDDPTRLAASKMVNSLEQVPIFGGSTVKLPSVTLTAYLFSHNTVDNVGYKRSLKDIIELVMGETHDQGGVIGLQEAPGNYKPDIRSIGVQTGNSDNDASHPGTWRLRVGAHYVESNLVVTNFSFRNRNMRTLLKDPSTGEIKVMEVPYFCALSFEVMNAGILTREDLIKILHL